MRLATGESHAHAGSRVGVWLFVAKGRVPIGDTKKPELPGLEDQQARNKHCVPNGDTMQISLRCHYQPKRSDR